MEGVGDCRVSRQQRFDGCGLRMVLCDVDPAQSIPRECYRLSQIDAGGSQLFADQLGETIDRLLQFGGQRRGGCLSHRQRSCIPIPLG